MSAARGSGTVIGMATRKVTITIEETHLEAIRSLVRTGAASSVSGLTARVTLETTLT
jgi:hypothetical protein